MKSANYLVPHCSTPPQTTMAGVCLGTITTLMALGPYLPAAVRSCRPDGVTPNQGIQVALAYIGRKPERMHEDFRMLAMEAFKAAWPCR
ncbi:Rap1a/Tai family immunity protein [Methylobacterium nigriterrae]|uniref:Rap1a/Tai family immunity protein n=1 Tax=Methylobacterium nigriterrae TaxID=3127512 RepID=UPI003D66709C